jgi:DNA-binding NarL/FixJ family response regulator
MIPTVSANPQPPPIRIVLVDDHALVLAGLRILIESQRGFAVVGEASAREEALAVVARERPAIVLLDLDLAGQSGLDLIPGLLACSPESRILVLTGVRDAGAHQKAVRAGARGVLLKEMAADVLIKAIEKVHAGEAWLNRAMVANVLADLPRPGRGPDDPEGPRIRSLSGREREVLALIGEALSNKRIAERLNVTETTVRHHLTSIFGTLGVSDRLELLVYAHRHKLVPPPS